MRSIPFILLTLFSAERMACETAAVYNRAMSLAFP